MTTTDGEGPQWGRLGRFVHLHRTQQGLSQREISERGGPSDTLLGLIESGEWRPKRGVGATLAKIDAGMHWQAGSASRTLAGGEPLEEGHTEQTDLSEVPSEELAAELLRRIPGAQPWIGNAERSQRRGRRNWPRWHDVPGSPDL
jgi:hypothetical protein